MKRPDTVKQRGDRARFSQGETTKDQKGRSGVSCAKLGREEGRDERRSSEAARTGSSCTRD